MPPFAGPSLARKISPEVDAFFRNFDPRIPFTWRLDPEPSVLDVLPPRARPSPAVRRGMAQPLPAPALAFQRVAPPTSPFAKQEG